MTTQYTYDFGGPSGFFSVILPPLLLAVAASPGSLQKKVAFAFVARNGRCSLELGTSLFEAAEFLKKVATDAPQQMVASKRRIIAQGVNYFETRCRA